MNWWRQLDSRGRILLAALILMLISLAGPHAKLPSRVYDWFFVLDITQSMNVRDVMIGGKSISRLEYSKLLMRDALRRLPCGSLVALGLFTERSTLNIQHSLEVCEHFGALDATIAKMDWRMAWAADSYIAHGVYSAVAQAPALGKDMRVAFFTDGGQAPVISERYKPVFEGESGAVKGIIFGVGSVIPARIPKLDEHDNIEGYWEPEDVQRYASFGLSELRSLMELGEDSGYHGRNAPHGNRPPKVENAHLSALDPDNLQTIAKITGLDYKPLADAADFVRSLKSAKMAAWRFADSDLRSWVIIPAVILLLVFFTPLSTYRFFKQRYLSRRKS